MSDLSTLSQQYIDTTKENSVDRAFQTLKDIKESQAKVENLANEHLDRINNYNMESLQKAVQGQGGGEQISPDGKISPPTPDMEGRIKTLRQANMQYEAQKSAMQIDMYRKMGLLGGQPGGENLPPPTQVASAMGKPVMSNQTAVGGPDMEPVPNQGLPSPSAMTPSVGQPQMIPSIGANGKMTLRGQDPNAIAKTQSMQERNKIATSNLDNRVQQNYIKQLTSQVHDINSPLGNASKNVDQAIKLRTMLNNSYDPKTDKFNVPPSIHTELAIGYARMLSPTGVVNGDLIEQLQQGTLRQKLAKAAIYFGEDPAKLGGPTQDVVKMFAKNIDAQGIASEDLRDVKVNGLKQMYASELKPADRDRLSKTVLSSSYKDFLSNSPDQYDYKTVNGVVHRRPKNGK